jgi:hypothetical protein
LPTATATLIPTNTPAGITSTTSPTITKTQSKTPTPITHTPTKTYTPSKTLTPSSTSTPSNTPTKTPLTSQSLKAYWSFENVSGTTAPDEADGNNTLSARAFRQLISITVLSLRYRITAQQRQRRLQTLTRMETLYSRWATLHLTR